MKSSQFSQRSQLSGEQAAKYPSSSELGAYFFSNDIQKEIVFDPSPSPPFVGIKCHYVAKRVSTDTFRAGTAAKAVHAAAEADVRVVQNLMCDGQKFRTPKNSTARVCVFFKSTSICTAKNQTQNQNQTPTIK